MKKRKSIGIIAAAALLLCAGCSGKSGGTASVDYEPTLGDSYPVQSDEKITYWGQLHESAAKNYNSLNETEFAKALKEKSGVNVEFIHPPVTQVSEKFNLLIASGEYPDIIEWGWYNFTGGPHTAIEDGVILPLNDVFEKSAPNLMKILDENPDYAKDISTDEGEYYCFPFIRESDYLNTFIGPMFRKDILDKIGCEVPETIDEWDNVLHKMKEAGVKIPLATIFDNNRLQQSSFFLGAYGVPGGFWVDGGEVKYGPYDQEAYSSFVKLLTGWYKDGLIDPDFVDTENSRVVATNSTPDWGVCESSCGGGFGVYIPAIQKVEPNAEFVPAKYPVLNKGDRPKFGHKIFNVQLSSGCAAITTQCKNIELAAKLLDFGYTDEGFMLYNFGVEGDSYNMVDGVPTYTDKIVNGEQPMAQVLAGYARASYFGPFVQAENYMKQYAKLDAQKQALDTWSQNDNTDYILPYVNYTADENSELSAIMNDINTYRQETLYAFITGTKSLDALPEYFETLKSMGIERAIEINQSAYERYQKR